MSDLLSKDALVILGILSGVFFVGTLIAIPIVLVRLPQDYFDENRPRIWLQGRHPLLRVTTYALKNAFGVVFLLAGVAMLVLPGQGILSMLIGISLMDFPGKRRLERRFVAQPAVLRTINGIRARFGRPPLVVEDAAH